jgi:hypothetical protein
MVHYMVLVVFTILVWLGWLLFLAMPGGTWVLLSPILPWLILYRTLPPHLR